MNEIIFVSFIHEKKEKNEEEKVVMCSFLYFDRKENRF